MPRVTCLFGRNGAPLRVKRHARQSRWQSSVTRSGGSLTESQCQGARQVVDVCSQSAAALGVLGQTAAVFAGTNTICVSTSASYSGCPSGAAQRTTLPSTYAGKRVLLRRGESFGSIAPRNTDTGFQVGAFGTGSKPNVAGVIAGMQSGVAS